MCIRPLTVAGVVLLGAIAWATPSSSATAQAASAYCHKGSACQGRRGHGVAAPAQTPASDMRRLAARAQAASAPCFDGFALVRRDLSALAGNTAGRARTLAALNADAQADRQACLHGTAALGPGAIPRSLQHSALAVDFVAHLRSALYDTAHACADALQVAAAAKADNAPAANAAVDDFGRTIQQQKADTTAAAADLLRLSAAFHL